MVVDQMKEKSNNNWGPFGIILVLIGIVSWFLGGMFSLGIGMVTVALGFFGNKKHQKLSQTGMIFGAFSLLFVNLMNLGIVPIPSSLESDKSHLVHSIKASIRAYEVLGKKDKDIDKMIKHLRSALKEARMVHIDSIDNQVPGFATHYRDEFIIGMESLIEGYEKSGLPKKLKGGFLLDRWAKWNKENRANLGKIKESSPSLISFIGGIITR